MRALVVLALAPACAIPDVVPLTDAASDAPAAACDAIVCEGFEGASWDPFWNVTTARGGRFVIDHTKAHRGGASLHFMADAAPNGGQPALELGHEPFTPTDFFVRAFVFVPSDPRAPARGENLFSLSRNDGQTGVLVSRYNTLVVATWGSPINFDPASTDAVLSSPSAWDCLEVHVSLDDAGTPHVDLWLRDRAYTVPAFASPVRVFPIGGVSLGLNIAESASLPAYELWLDDVIVDTKRVGCAR